MRLQLELLLSTRQSVRKIKTALLFQAMKIADILLKIDIVYQFLLWPRDGQSFRTLGRSHNYKYDACRFA